MLWYIVPYTIISTTSDKLNFKFGMKVGRATSPEEAIGRVYSSLSREYAFGYKIDVGRCIASCESEPKQIDL